MDIKATLKYDDFAFGGFIILVFSLQIQNYNNADVLLDSGLNLCDIIVNLCPKLHY